MEWAVHPWGSNRYNCPSASQTFEYTSVGHGQGTPVLMVVSMPRAAQAMPYMLAREKET